MHDDGGHWGNSDDGNAHTYKWDKDDAAAMQAPSFGVAICG